MVLATTPVLQGYLQLRVSLSTSSQATPICHKVAPGIPEPLDNTRLTEISALAAEQANKS